MKKKKEPYIQKTGLLNNAVDYNVSYIKLPMKIIYIILATIAGASVGYLFFEGLFFAVVVGIVCALGILPIRKKQVIEKRKKKLQLQFRDMLESLATSIGAGSNITDAFRIAESDMITQYSTDVDIVKELQIINSGVRSNINIEDLLLDFAERSGISDVMSFANVFDTCYRKGGDTKEVIKNTHQIIRDKIDIMLEIQTVVAANKSEQNAMLFMPIVFVVLIKQMGTDMIDLSSPIGRLSTFIALGLFVAAYFIGKKVLDIKV